MNLLNIGIAQVNPIVGALKFNFEKILSFWKVLDENSHLCVFPELALTGYPPEDLLLRYDFLKKSESYIEKLIKVSKSFSSILVIGAPLIKDHLSFNTLLVIQKGKIIGTYFKRFLPNYSVFDEKRYFTRGIEPLLVEVEVAPNKRVKIGFSICEDVWHPDGWEPTYARLGAEVLVNINASPYHKGKFEQKLKFLSARAIDNQSFLAYVNLTGGQDELVFDGRSLVLSPEGKLIFIAKAFEEDAKIVSVPFDQVKKIRLLEQRLKEGVIQSPETIKVQRTSCNKMVSFVKNEVKSVLEGEAEVYRAICTGIRDYVEKNGFKKVIVGVSGGIDSALTLCLAVDALGNERVMPVFMPSNFTSKESKEDAEELCKNLRLSLKTYSIFEVFEVFRKVLNSKEFGLADENLQARIRANILFYLSNKEGALVLSTSNKSETAVGYTTIYGDMAGGFAPLKDVYKTEVYALARYRNSISPVIPEKIFVKPPTAELRENQKDQDTLPPYPVLDEILKLYVEEGFSEEEIVIKTGFTEDLVKKVILMLKKAEFKRKQAPIGVKVSKRAFGRDWRMPVTNKFC